MKVQVVAVVVHFKLPGLTIATYVRFAVVVTAGHETVNERLPTSDCTPVGTAGGPSGVPNTETAGAAPYWLLPTIENVYCWLLTRPVTVHVVVFVEHVAPPGDAVTTYVIPAPSPGCCAHETAIAWSAAVAV